MSGYEDPALRLARLRELFAAEQPKMQTADHNGQVIDPVPDAEDNEQHAEPAHRLPAPNPALGSSANGPPDDTPPAAYPTAGVRPEVGRLRQLVQHDEQRREQQRRAAHEQALADHTARVHYQSRR